MTNSRTFHRALGWAYAATLGQRGISMLLTCILAVVLGPREFGLVAMAMAFIIVIEMLVGQGVSAALIQRREITPAHYNSAFWVVMLTAAAFTVGTIVVSGWWSEVNRLPELQSVLNILSLSIPLTACQVLPRAILQRSMDFRSIAIYGSLASLISGIVGVSLAFSGAGVWSLVVQQLLSVSIATMLLWRASKWRPRLCFSITSMRDLHRFGRGVVISQLGVYVAGQADALLLGLFFGPVAVGLYRMAERVMSVVLEIGTRSIQLVALPHFSQYQDDDAATRRAVLACVRLSALITMPVLAVLAASSAQIMAALGAEWVPAAGTLKVLVVLGMMKSVTLFAGPLMLSRGRAHLTAFFAWALGAVVSSSIIGVGLFLTETDVEHQIVAVATARTVGFTLVMVIPSLFIVRRLCGLQPLALLGAMRPALIGAAAAILMAIPLSDLPITSSGRAVPAFFAMTIPTAFAAILAATLADAGLRRLVIRRLGQLIIHTFGLSRRRSFGVMSR